MNCLHFIVCLLWALLLFAVVIAVLFRDRLRSVLPRRYDINNFRASIILGLALATILLTLIGHLASRNVKEAMSAHIVNSIYQTTQILMMNDDTNDNNIALSMGRLAAVATIVLIASEALQLLFADSIQRMYLWRKRNHVIICGLGRVGSVLVKDLLIPGQENRGRVIPARMRFGDVVVVEDDRQNDNLDMARDAGAIIVHGDATDEQLLYRLSAQKAKSVFLVTGSDEENLEGAVNLKALTTSVAEKPHIYVHLVHGELGGLLKNVPAATPFNIIRRTAVDLVTRRILPYRPITDTEVAHFVIVGFGQMGQEILRLLAELGHFENRKRSRMTVIYCAAERDAVEAFRLRFPKLFSTQAPNASPWDLDAELDKWSYGVTPADLKNITPNDHGIDFVANGSFHEDAAAPASESFITGVMSLARKPDVKALVILCGEVEEQNCTLGRQLRNELDQRCKKAGQFLQGISSIPVFAYVPQKPMLTELAGQSGDDMILFGACHEVCSYDALTLDIDLPLATAIANSYDAVSATPSPRFTDRPAWDQYSNLSSAAHLHIKLAKFGWEIVPLTDPRAPIQIASVSKEDETIAAQMEHNRWIAERLLAGWTFGRRDDAAKQRGQLIHWDALPESETRKDFAQIRTTLAFCSPTSTGTDGKPWPFKLVMRVP